MTRLDNLIFDLCPYGVEHIRLSDAVTISRGTRVVRSQLTTDAPYPVYQNSLTPLGYFSKSNCSADTVFIIMAGAAGEIGYSEKPFWAADDCYYLLSNSHFLSRFLYHFLLNVRPLILSHVRKASVPRLSRKAIENLIVPVPPLKVQQEIVRILDQFTQLTAELTKKLDAEYIARKKQFTFYKTTLFQQSPRATVKYLDEISENCDNLRKPVTSGNRTKGDYPYYGASGIVDYVDSYIFDGDYLLVSEDGANLLARSTPIAFSITGKNWVNNHAHVLRFEEYATRRYVEFYLNAMDLSPYVTGGAQPKLNQKNLNRIPIFLPPLPEQRRIVAILDRFDALCNDLTSGLPAEIAARQKQYEYYRDKLLTFPERKN